LPADIQALILSRMTADELRLVTDASAGARRVVDVNLRKCALGNVRCSNYWRDEFERTRMTAVRSSPEYRAYLASLGAEERDVILDEARSRDTSATSVRNALCRIGCEQRAVVPLETYLYRVFREPYPVVFGLTRDWPRRGQSRDHIYAGAPRWPASAAAAQRAKQPHGRR
jgi:hypothetical protein